MSPKRIIVVIVIMVITLGVTSMASHSELIRPNKSFNSFPMEIKAWKGHRGQLDSEVYNILGVEDYVLADYFRGANKVNFYLGFYQSQKEGDLIHSPKNCIPGAGWSISHTKIETLGINSQGEVTKVAYMVVERGAKKQMVLYWFQSRGRIIASEYMQKFWLVWDSIFRRRTDGAFVRLMTPVTNTEAETLMVLKEFARELYPHLKAFLPS